MCECVMGGGREKEREREREREKERKKERKKEREKEKKVGHKKQKYSVSIVRELE
jgi:hypothetical protein